MRIHGATRIRVGIIGANPDRGWAAQAHIPALKSLSDDFEKQRFLEHLSDEQTKQLAAICRAVLGP
jgi:predicted dehydrogenase